MSTTYLSKPQWELHTWPASGETRKLSCDHGGRNVTDTHIDKLHPVVEKNRNFVVFHRHINRGCYYCQEMTNDLYRSFHTEPEALNPAVKKLALIVIYFPQCAYSYSIPSIHSLTFLIYPSSSRKFLLSLPTIFLRSLSSFLSSYHPYLPSLLLINKWMNEYLYICI